MTTATTERAWTTVGAEYTGGEDRERVEAAISELTWTRFPEAGVLDLPAVQGLAIKAAITELRLPKVSALAWDGYLWYPDGPESVHASLYGVEANYKNGQAKVYLLDTGGQLLPLCSDFTAHG